MKRAAGLTGCREVNLLAQTCVVSLQAGAFLQFSGSGPKQGNWDAQVTPGDCRAKRVLLHVLVWKCPHLGMRGKCLHSGGAMGTLTESYTTQLGHQAPSLRRTPSPGLDGAA